MNKGKKIISTLAIASMLAGNVLPIASLAATTAADSGVYTTNGSKYVGFRRSQAQATTKLTLAEVVEKVGAVTLLNGKAVTDTTTEVTTGDVVTTADSTYTVVLYGDVDKSGLVDVNDALAIAKHAAERADAQLTGAFLEAANVGNHDGTVDVTDALTVAKYAAERADTNYVIDPMPNDPEQEVPTTQYAMTVNENNVINNVNENNASLELTKVAEENKTLKLVVYDENGAKPVTINTIKLVKGEKTVYENTGDSSFDFSATSILDGNLSFELYETDENGKDVLVGKQTVVKNTVEPKLVHVNATRKDTDKATFTGLRFGESDIQTVYYCAVPMNVSLAPNWNKAGENAKTFDEVSGFKPTTKKINMAGKDSFEETITGLEIDKAYKVYYVLENSYGSQSLTASSVDLSKAVSLEKATKVNSEKIEFVKEDKKFTWESVSGASKYIVTLYKDGKILEEREVANATTGYTLPAELEHITLN